MIEEPFEPPLADRLPLELPPPPALRADTLAAVRGARRRRQWARWGGGAIAALLLLMVGSSLTPREKRASDVPGGASILLAAERARPTFAALDAAEAELRGALDRDPANGELLASLAALRDRREAIQRLVREAAS